MSIDFTGYGGSTAGNQLGNQPADGAGGFDDRRILEQVEKERLDRVKAIGTAQVEQHHGDAFYLRHLWTSSTRVATWAGGVCGTIP